MVDQASTSPNTQEAQSSGESPRDQQQQPQTNPDLTVRLLSDRRVFQAVLNLKRRYKSTTVYAVDEHTLAVSIDVNDIVDEIKEKVRQASSVYFKQGDKLIGGYIIIEFEGSKTGVPLDQDPKVRAGVERLKQIGYNVTLYTDEGKGYVILDAEEIGRNIAKEIKFFKRRYAIDNGRLIITIIKGGGS